MATGFRVIVETYDIQSNTALTREEVDNFELKAPTHIKEVGLDQAHQIKILQSILDALLPQQFVLLDEDDICPECGKRSKKAGKYNSHFHSVYTDHKVTMVRRMCTCGWKRKYTVEGQFGFSSHPDLLKMQCDLGSEQNYMKAQEALERKNGRKRTVNNRSNISRTISEFGEAMSELKAQTSTIKVDEPTKLLVAQIDGGHIPTNIKGKRSYEVLACKIYQLNNIKKISAIRNELSSSTYVASAKSDRQSTIKKQVLYGALKEGLSEDTKVYLLADGAKNCWSAASLLKEHCKAVISILDWSHIGRAFKHTEQELAEEYHEALDKAKWSLWHGDVKKCMDKLASLTKFDDNQKLVKLKKIRTYINNNAGNIIDYASYKEKGLPFTSSIIAGAVDNVINARQKRTKKMQWTREGAHSVVQLRASKASRTWDADWDNAVEYLLAA